MKGQVKVMSDDNLPFWALVLSWVKSDWWKTIFTTVIVALIGLLCGPSILQCIMNSVTNPKVDVVLPNWRSESQGAISPYEWCSYYELRASRVGNEGGNRQNRLHLESSTPSWAGLWTLSYTPNIYGNDIPTGKPGPLDGRAPGLLPRLSVAQKNTRIICVTE